MSRSDAVLDNPDVENGVHYPSSDGTPMAETDFHLLAMRLLLDALEDLFKDREDVYVTGNVKFFWVEGNPKIRRAPDAMVVFGINKGGRRSFRTWNEGDAVPAVCFEMASRKTWKSNLGKVKEDYEAAGVKEYFVFDPRRECLPSPLIGFRRKGKTFRELKPDINGVIISEQLGVCLVPEGTMLRLVRIETGERVLTRTEQFEQIRAEMSAKLARLEAENARLKSTRNTNGRSANGHT